MVACGCACKYCLLSSEKKSCGVDYYRGKRLAQRFLDWKLSGGYQLSLYYSIGFCADYPQLADNISFNRKLGFPGAEFLQCNGIRIMDNKETIMFVITLKESGITRIDTTFYGTQEYHDRFAARKGDYAFMLRLAEAAVNAGIICSPSMLLCEENLGMVGEVFDTLSPIAGTTHIHAFPQDYRGRGYLLEGSRLTSTGYEMLPLRVKEAFNIMRYKTEAEWLMSPLPEHTQRVLNIAIREDNIEMLENMSCDEIISYVEKLDDAYYDAIPTINVLAELYGDKDNTRLYRPRDLFWKWQKRYLQDNNIHIHDVTDERLCGAVRS